MIVGESNTAKTVTWKVLQHAMTSMKSDKKPGYTAVHVYPINPKALSLAELYGEYNLTTGEWHDGVISSIMRKTCSGTQNSLYFLATTVWSRQIGQSRQSLVTFDRR